jgi:predicted helicase
MGTKGKKVYPDGIVKNLFGLDIGLWESKDEKDTIDDEIDAKLKKGYPFTNILFEDTNTAVLYQRNVEVSRVSVRDAEKLHEIISTFISFKSETIFKFEDAMEKFKADIPAIVETLRKRIDETRVINQKFIEANAVFLELCKAEINPEITEADIREMMIQHILTSDIFNKIFDDPEFHRHNNIACELGKLIEILFTFSELKNLMGNIEHYYDAINAAASGITDHHEKQKFLKVLYENFYKVYNPKAADRLGVVYTPNEIVQFMIESTDYLLHKHFGKTLADKNVEILDPATGTGTFITSIIDHIPKQNLVYKYNNEIHANEVAILPYYIANLNVEFTFKQKMGYYEEFKNLCFVDTLDNTDANQYAGQQHGLFGLTSENSERIKRQNSKKISVIIGNPPYNAKQENYSMDNANRTYPAIDKRIKDTYVKAGTAQNQIGLYDMYTRFLRWATDRIDKNGVLAFVSNSSFIDSKAYDGFRKIIAEEFNEIWVVNLKGNARTSGERRRTEGGNIFSDQIRVGVAIYFLVRKETKERFKVFYNEIGDYVKAEEKKEYLRLKNVSKIDFELLLPDEKNNWINLSDNDFDELMPIIDKDVKAEKSQKALFQLFSRGIATQRDEWIYDSSKDALENKVKFMIDTYSKTLSDKKYKEKDLIKWDRELDKYLERGIKKNFEKEKIITALYRPFYKQSFYFDKHFNGMTYQWFDIFNLDDNSNKYIAINSIGNNKNFHCLGSASIIDLHLTGDSQCLPLYRYTATGERIENITDWGLEQFRNHYKKPHSAKNMADKPAKATLSLKKERETNAVICKEDIFNYTYAVLHNPAYRKKYELNLKREFPRIPFYENFWQWAKWGKKLMELHINYETVKPFALKIVNVETRHGVSLQKPDQVKEKDALQPKIKVKLKADKEKGIIELDELTFLSGIPKEAWEYKLGNRSALEWILDQYKEKKPTDPTIAEKFNTYRFADYKEQVIDLLKRVCTVSVETMKIIREMELGN